MYSYSLFRPTKTLKYSIYDQQQVLTLKQQETVNSGHLHLINYDNEQLNNYQNSY